MVKKTKTKQNKTKHKKNKTKQKQQQSKNKGKTRKKKRKTKKNKGKTIKKVDLMVSLFVPSTVMDRGPQNMVHFMACGNNFESHMARVEFFMDCSGGMPEVQGPRKGGSR